VELYGPDGAGWFRTAVMDWIALSERLRDADVRGYLVLRSLVGSKWARPVRKLTLDELRHLIPSPSGGPSGLTRVRDLLRSLTGVGLVTTPEGAPLTTTSRRSGAAKPLRIRVNDEAPAGYRGWRNAADKLANIQGRQVGRAGLTQPSRSGRNSSPLVKTSRKSGPTGCKSDPRSRKSDSHDGSDLHRRSPISPLSTTSSLSRTVAHPPPAEPAVQEVQDAQETTVNAVLAAWATGARCARAPASVRDRLAGQVPYLLQEYGSIEHIRMIAHFAGARRWVDLPRAAMHPDCQQSLAPPPCPGPARTAGVSTASQEALLAEIGVTGTGL